MSWGEVAIVGAAAWRITAMLSYESGPGQVFRRFRSALGIRHNDAGEPNFWPSGLITDIIACPWCLGVYAAALSWAVWEYVSEPIVVVFAAAAVVVAVERWCHAR